MCSETRFTKLKTTRYLTNRTCDLPRSHFFSCMHRTHSQPIATLLAGVWEQMVSQLRALVQPHKVGPICDAGRLHPSRTALHVAVAEPTTLPVDDPWPRCMRPPALARHAMSALTSLECIAAHLTRECRLYCSQAIGVLLLQFCNGLLLTRDVLSQHRAGATESHAAQILPELILLILKLPTGVDNLCGLPRAAQPPDWSWR